MAHQEPVPPVIIPAAIARLMRATTGKKPLPPSPRKKNTADDDEGDDDDDDDTTRLDITGGDDSDDEIMDTQTSDYHGFTALLSQKPKTKSNTTVSPSSPLSPLLQQLPSPSPHGRITSHHVTSYHITS